MLLGVCEGRDASLVYGGEVDEEHVYAACPSIRLLGSTLDMGDWCFLVEEWGAISSPEYHWRRVLCIMLIAGGGRRLRESK